jgi:hypothetical protein
MVAKVLKRYYVLLILLLVGSNSFGQNVPLGIFYQAVARDNYGKELVNKDIDVKFSIISGNPLGTVVYQELHSKVNTSKFGVFSLIIGHGTPTGGTYGELSQIQWGQAYHYLKIEVKFDNDFIDMGTIQFLAVPYALYAQKSLEPGPAGAKGDPGPKGDPGDPASDKQTLSFDQNNLTISGGNAVPLTSLLQSLTITNTPEGNFLGISRGNSVLLASAEADGDPTNEIQDLTISSDKLKITKNPSATEWDLTRYLDNTDNQALSWNAATRKLGISGSTGTIDLTELKNDADADPTNELQNLSYNESTHTLSISNGTGAVLGNLVAFRAEKVNPAGSTGTEVPLVFETVRYNDGSAYNNSTGEFVAPSDGIYTFNIRYDAAIGAKVSLYLNAQLYEIIADVLSNSGAVYRSITLKLTMNNTIKVIVSTGIASQSGTGSFSGYKVY